MGALGFDVFDFLPIEVDLRDIVPDPPGSVFLLLWDDAVTFTDAGSDAIFVMLNLLLGLDSKRLSGIGRFGR